MTAALLDLLASPWGAPVLAAASLALVAAGAGLGATYDRLTTRARHTRARAVARARLTPNGAHRR